MLLIAEPLTHDYHTILQLWEVQSKKSIYVEPPFKPYFYSRKPWAKAESMKKTFLSDMKKRWVWKAEFNTTGKLGLARTDYTMEDDIPFVQRIAIDVGYKYPSPLPKGLAWDIETYVDGILPNPYKDRLRSIGYWIDSKHNGCYVNDPYTKDGEREVIKQFRNVVLKENPDLIIDFYGRFYDFPTLMNRADALGFRLDLGRDGSTPYVVQRDIQKRGRIKTEHSIRLGGRLHFDVNKEAEADYSLTLAGVHTNLNDVATHFAKKAGFEPPISDVNHANIPKDRLEETNIDDCRVTMEVAKIYLETLYYFCDELNVPLSLIVRRSPSHIPNYALAQEYFKMGIISDGANQDRYPWVFQTKKACSGGYVKCLRPGLHRKVSNWDFKSLYPSIMIAFNLSPETVSLVSRKPSTGNYRFEDHGNYAIIEVPDIYHGQVTCKVDLTRDGVTRVLQKRYRKKRAETKLKTHNNAVKVMANSMFGYNLMRYARYGNPLVGILITNIGRHLINNSVKDKNVIEIDTDGYWVESNGNK